MIFNLVSYLEKISIHFNVFLASYLIIHEKLEIFLLT